MILLEGATARKAAVKEARKAAQTKSARPNMINEVYTSDSLEINGNGFASKLVLLTYIQQMYGVRYVL